MAKEIIVLGVTVSNIFTSVNCLFWFPIVTGAKTQTSGSVWPGATAAENTAIQNGTVIEEQGSFQVPSGLPTANIKAYLNEYWTNRNAQVNGTGPGLYQNVFFDSVTGWSA